MTTVWIVCQVKNAATNDWELGGVFTTYEGAVAACTHPDDCVWSTVLDKRYGREPVYPPDRHYPLT